VGVVEQLIAEFLVELARHEEDFPALTAPEILGLLAPGATEGDIGITTGCSSREGDDFTG